MEEQGTMFFSSWQFYSPGANLWGFFFNDSFKSHLKIHPCLVAFGTMELTFLRLWTVWLRILFLSTLPSSVASLCLILHCKFLGAGTCLMAPEKRHTHGGATAAAADHRGSRWLCRTELSTSFVHLSLYLPVHFSKFYLSPFDVSKARPNLPVQFSNRSCGKGGGPEEGRWVAGVGGQRQPHVTRHVTLGP